jgi:sugar phosphate isomerase/epimerase
MPELDLDRRSFLARAATVAAIPLGAANLAGPLARRRKFSVFIKPLQSLSYDALAAAIKKLGFDGIEATVRKNGHVLPERVEEDLPKLVGALSKHKLSCTVMATDVNRVDKLNERVLRTASKLGIGLYRMGALKYDLKRSVHTQLKELSPQIKELAALNRSLGISGVYQNHAGARRVGAACWDLHAMVADIPPEEIGVAFDIRHAQVEGGLCWPVHWNLLKEHVRLVYFKDFQWQGARLKNVPLGEGIVAKKFFRGLTEYDGPISLHIEYLRDAGVDKNLAAIRTDFATLRKLLPD